MMQSISMCQRLIFSIKIISQQKSMHLLKKFCYPCTTRFIGYSHLIYPESHCKNMQNISYSLSKNALLKKFPNHLLPSNKSHDLFTLPNVRYIHFDFLKWSSTSQKDSDESKGEDPEKDLSMAQKFKLMYKRYWYVLVPVHIVTSILWFGGFYFATKSGIDLVPVVEQIGVSDRIVSYLKGSNTGYYAVSYALYKIASPARYTVTLGGTTLSINYLKNRGYIKPVPTKEELKEMYVGKKEELMDKGEEIKEKYQERKEAVIERYQERKEEIIERYQEKRDEMMGKYQERKKSLSDEKNEMKSPKR